MYIDTSQKEIINNKISLTKKLFLKNLNFIFQGAPCDSWVDP